MTKQSVRKNRSSEPVEPENRAVDGLLREFAANGSGPDQELISRILSEARSMTEVKDENATGKPTLVVWLKYLLPLAACLAIAGLLIFRSDSPVKAVKNRQLADSALLIATTPGGVLERADKTLAISNGMKVSGNDKIKTYKSSVAYLQFNDLSRIEIGGDSKVSYNGTTLTKNPDNSVSKNVTLALHSGAIYGDIVKDHGRFTITTPHGKISISQGKFLLVNTADSCYLEVLRGKLKFKSASSGKVIKMAKGELCLINQKQPLQVANINNISSAALNRQVERYRQRLPLNDSGFEELILKLYQKRKADICLQRNPKRNQRIFL